MEPDLFPDYHLPIVGTISAEPELTMTERFWAFHKANGHIYVKLSHEAAAAWNRGVRRWSVQGIYEILRWKRSFVTTDGDYRLNNDFVAYYTRLLVRDMPYLDSMFSVRRSEADRMFESE